MTDKSLWDWSLAYYDRPGVAPALLALQNRCEVDVPLLLWRLWLVETGRAVAPETEAEAVRLSAAWGAGVVGPLRAARDVLKAQLTSAAPLVDRSGALDLRTRVLAVEMSAEQLQLAALEALAGPAAAPTAPRQRIEMIRSFSELASATDAELSMLIAALDGL